MRIYILSLLIAKKLSEVMCPSYMNKNFDNKLSIIPETCEKEYVYNIGSHDFSDFIELAEVVSYIE